MSTHTTSADGVHTPSSYSISQVYWRPCYNGVDATDQQRLVGFTATILKSWSELAVKFTSVASIVHLLNTFRALMEWSGNMVDANDDGGNAGNGSGAEAESQLVRLFESELASEFLNMCTRIHACLQAKPDVNDVASLVLSVPIYYWKLEWADLSDSVLAEAQPCGLYALTETCDATTLPSSRPMRRVSSSICTFRDIATDICNWIDSWWLGRFIISETRATYCKSCFQFSVPMPLLPTPPSHKRHITSLDCGDDDSAVRTRPPATKKHRYDGEKEIVSSSYNDGGHENNGSAVQLPLQNGSVVNDLSVAVTSLLNTCVASGIAADTCSSSSLPAPHDFTNHAVSVPAMSVLPDPQWYPSYQFHPPHAAPATNQQWPSLYADNLSQGRGHLDVHTHNYVESTEYRFSPPPPPAFYPSPSTHHAHAPLMLHYPNHDPYSQPMVSHVPAFPTHLASPLPPPLPPPPPPPPGYPVYTQDVHSYPSYYSSARPDVPSNVVMHLTSPGSPGRAPPVPFTLPCISTSESEFVRCETCSHFILHECLKSHLDTHFRINQEIVVKARRLACSPTSVWVSCVERDVAQQIHTAPICHDAFISAEEWSSAALSPSSLTRHSSLHTDGKATEVGGNGNTTVWCTESISKLNCRPIRYISRTSLLRTAIPANDEGSGDTDRKWQPELKCATCLDKFEVCSVPLADLKLYFVVHEQEEDHNNQIDCYYDCVQFVNSQSLLCWCHSECIPRDNRLLTLASSSLSSAPFATTATTTTSTRTLTTMGLPRLADFMANSSVSSSTPPQIDALSRSSALSVQVC